MRRIMGNRVIKWEIGGKIIEVIESEWKEMNKNER